MNSQKKPKIFQSQNSELRRYHYKDRLSGARRLYNPFDKRKQFFFRFLSTKPNLLRQFSKKKLFVATSFCCKKMFRLSNICKEISLKFFHVYYCWLKPQKRFFVYVDKKHLFMIAAMRLRPTSLSSPVYTNFFSFRLSSHWLTTEWNPAQFTEKVHIIGIYLLEWHELHPAHRLLSMWTITIHCTFLLSQSNLNSSHLRKKQPNRRSFKRKTVIEYFFYILYSKTKLTRHQFWRE